MLRISSTCFNVAIPKTVIFFSECRSNAPPKAKILKAGLRFKLKTFRNEEYVFLRNLDLSSFFIANFRGSNFKKLWVTGGILILTHNFSCTFPTYRRFNSLSSLHLSGAYSQKVITSIIPPWCPPIKYEKVVNTASSTCLHTRCYVLL